MKEDEYYNLKFKYDGRKKNYVSTLPNGKIAILHRNCRNLKENSIYRCAVKEHGKYAIAWTTGNLIKDLKNGTYVKWRFKILEKFNYKCCLCDNEANECHHGLGWSYFPDERYYIDNGFATCHECHRKIHDENIGVTKLKMLIMLKRFSLKNVWMYIKDNVIYIPEKKT